MLTNGLFIWGAGGHASVVADLVRVSGAGTIAGFIDDRNPTRHGELFCGARVLGGSEQLETFHRDGISRVIIAIGDCAARLRVADAAVQAGVAAMDPWRIAGLALTFLDRAGVDPAAGFDGSVERLGRLKHEFDADNMFIAAHAVPVTACQVRDCPRTRR